MLGDTEADGETLGLTLADGLTLGDTLGDSVGPGNKAKMFVACAPQVVSHSTTSCVVSDGISLSAKLINCSPALFTRVSKESLGNSENV